MWFIWSVWSTHLIAKFVLYNISLQIQYTIWLLYTVCTYAHATDIIIIILYADGIRMEVVTQL